MDEAKDGSFSENTGPAGQQLNQSDLGLVTASPRSLHPPVHNIFIDDHGLRAGWRFLLYVGLWRVFLILITTLVRYAQPHEAHGIWQELIAELEFLASAVLPTLVMAAIEKRPFRRLRPSAKVCLRKIVLGGHCLGHRGHFSVSARDRRGWRFLPGWFGIARRANLQIRAFLGRIVSCRRLVRGVSAARLSPIRADPRHGFLAGRYFALVLFCGFALRQSRRNLGWLARGRGHWIFFVSDFSPNRDSVVHRGLSRCMGLGRELSVLRT